MRPTEVLKSEHRIIEQVLGCLHAIAERAATEGKLDKTSARQAVDFLKTFADGCHHGKEEKHLFPMLESKGLPRDGGPTGVMLHEHEQGRGHIRGMSEAVEHTEDKEAAQEFARHARAYVRLLQEHIAKEDNVLFNMADHILTDEDQQRVLQAFAQVEHKDMGEGTHEKYLAIADALAERYNVPKAAQAAGHKGHGGCSCSCGHGH